MRVLGPTIVRTYVRPLRFRGRRVAYDAGQSWDARYSRAVESGELDDATTMKRGHNPLRTRYHYNAVENAILEALLDDPPPQGFRFLDIGSGAGHWLDFYRATLGAGEAVGVEISPAAARTLRARYEGEGAVEIVVGDVADPGFRLERSFDLVSAVGVLFHVVRDDAWRLAVANLAAHLAPNGRLLVAEQVAALSLDVGFRQADELLVNKRVRSLRSWRACAQAAGLELRTVAQVRKSRSLAMPVNRVLVLARPR